MRLGCFSSLSHFKSTLSLFLPPSPSPDEGVWDSFIRLIPPSSRSVTVPLERLRSGISYEFRVIAINRYGYGQPSAPTAALAGNYTWLRVREYAQMQIRPIDKAFLFTFEFILEMWCCIAAPYS